MENNIVLEEKPIKTSFYYGWIVLVIAALSYFFSGPGQTYSISIFIDRYINEFSWSRSLISSLYSMATLISGLILTIIGKYIDKLGQRKMITIVPIIFGIACFWMSIVFNPIMIFIGFLFLRLLGQGSMTLIPQTLIPHWFKHKRGLALSIMGIGGVLASSLLPPLNNLMLNSLGLAFTWRFWGILLIFLMAPLGWFFVRNNPENIGLKPDGIEKENFKNQVFPRVYISNAPWTLKQAMTTRAFWFMVYCAVVPSLINTGLIFHMLSIINEKGFSSGFAAYILSISAIIRFPITFLAGYLLDRTRVHILKGLNFFLLTGALFLILQADSKITLIIYALVHGIFMAFDSVSTGVLWPNYFGNKHIGSIRGFTMTAIVIGSSLGPLPFGIAYDIFSGYKEIMIIVMFLPIVAIIAAFVSPPPEYSVKKGEN